MSEEPSREGLLSPALSAGPCSDAIADGRLSDATLPAAVAGAWRIIQPSTAAMMVVWGDQQRLCNAACARLLAERLGGDPAWRAGLQSIIDQVFADCPDLRLPEGREHRLRLTNGAGVFQIEVHASPLYSDDEDAVGALVMLVERSSDAGEAREKSVRRDIEFRFRNVFATLRSILSGSVETTASIEDLDMHLSGRIDALSRIHSALLRQPAGADLGQLVCDELTAAAGLLMNVVIDGPDFMLHPAAVEPLGLALHELATNAIKYGALGDPDRSLCVRWQLDEPGSTLTLEWIETGVSVLATAPRKRGFGFAFLEQALAYELNAQVDLKLAPGGLRCSIVMPVPAAMA